MSEPALRRAAGDDAAVIGRVVDAADGACENLLGRTPFPMLADHALAVRELGRRPLGHAEAEARRHGFAEVRLPTSERYAADLAMCRRNGHVETHREPYQGTDLVYLRKALPAADDVADEGVRA